MAVRLFDENDLFLLMNSKIEDFFCIHLLYILPTNANIKYKN